MIAKRYDDELMYSVQKCDDDSSNKYKYCTRDGKLAFKKPSKDFLGATKENIMNLYVIEGSLYIGEYVGNNVYGRFASFFKNYELKEADKYIKRVFPNAEYYVDYELGALVFEPLENEEVDLEDRTVINEKGYKGTFTSKYRDLVKNYEENTFEQNGEKFEQITLF